SSCFCCFSCWMTAWYVCSGRPSWLGRSSEIDELSSKLRRILRIAANPRKNAKAAAARTTDMRITIGLVRSLTAAPSTSGEVDLRKKRPAWPFRQEKRRTASGAGEARSARNPMRDDAPHEGIHDDVQYAVGCA